MIETFNHPRLSQDVKTAIEELKTTLGSQFRGLIIDVRSNPGGLVSQVVNVTGNFLDGGEVFSARGRQADDTQRYNADNGVLLDEDVPIIVLINSRSASAAEIIAGALQDRNRAVIMGRRSFGKGSVQSVMQMPIGGALRLTTQRYYTPSGKSIQGLGIMPDILVDSRPQDKNTENRFREDSLQNALINPNGKDYEEDYSRMIFPPDDWPDDEDFQLNEAVKTLNNGRYQTIIRNRDAAL